MGSLICLMPQPDKYLYGKRQSGWMEVGMLLKTSIDARCFMVAHRGSVSFLGIFKSLNPHFWSFMLFQFEFPMKWPGGEDAVSGGVCKQDQLEHENVQHLHCLFIDHSDSPWSTFAYLNVKIVCILRGTSDSGCGFTSGHFLINGRTVLGLEKTQRGNTDLSSHLRVRRD